MARHELRDDQWQKIKNLLPGKKGDPGVTARDNWLFVDGVLWIARTGARWRELPAEFGKCMKVHATNWNSVFQRYNRWFAKGVWERLLLAPLKVQVQICIFRAMFWRVTRTLNM